MRDILLGDKLTIILTLKGRAEFTFRWINYANKRRFPFTILIADGGADDSVKKYLDKEDFVDLNIRYVKFKEDINFEAFYRKVRSALELINTPYYIMADNDDFFSLSGLTEAVRYLENNTDYVACGGKLTPFSITNGNVYGDGVKLYDSNYAYYPESDPSERLIKYLNGAPGIYYSVIKTEIGRAIWEKICKFNFKDIRMPEFLIDCLVITSGKVYNLNSPFYFRQIGVGIGNTANLSHDFFDEVFAPTWSLEINQLADLVIDTCLDKLSREEFWFHLKRFFLPRVLISFKLDPLDSRYNKNRKIMLKKILWSRNFLSLLTHLCTFYKRHEYKKHSDVVFIKKFLKNES